MPSPSDHYHDLYLMLGPHFDTLSLRHSNEGTAGFEAYAAKNARRALEKGYFPDNWLFHYQFAEEQLARVPLSAERNENYFRTLLPALNKQNVVARHILPLERASMLYDQGKPLLSTYEQVQTSKVCDFTTSGSNNALEMRNTRPPFDAYNAVEIGLGVLLFSPTDHGLHKLENFLQYTADHFFNSVGVLSSLTMSLHRVPAFDPALKKAVDIWPDDTAATLKNRSTDDVCELFLRKSAICGSIVCHKFDMRPTLENFKIFVTPTKHTGLAISRFNADLGHLLYIEKNGITAEAPFPTEEVDYTPITGIESLREVMRDAQVTEKGIQRLQYGAKARAADLIDRLFPEYKDTVLNFNMKEKMHRLAEQALEREKRHPAASWSPAADLERTPLRHHKL